MAFLFLPAISTVDLSYNRLNYLYKFPFYKTCGEKDQAISVDLRGNRLDADAIWKMLGTFRHLEGKFWVTYLEISYADVTKVYIVKFWIEKKLVQVLWIRIKKKLSSSIFFILILIRNTVWGISLTETPPGQRPPRQIPPSVQRPPSGQKPLVMWPVVHAGTETPSTMNRMTHRCKNITLPQPRCRW